MNKLYKTLGILLLLLAFLGSLTLAMRNSSDAKGVELMVKTYAGIEDALKETFAKTLEEKRIIGIETMKASKSENGMMAALLAAILGLICFVLAIRKKGVPTGMLIAGFLCFVLSIIATPSLQLEGSSISASKIALITGGLGIAGLLLSFLAKQRKEASHITST